MKKEKVQMAYKRKEKEVVVVKEVVVESPKLGVRKAISDNGKPKDQAHIK